MSCEDIECPTIRPYVARIGGPQPSEDQVSLVFTPGFPCGVERDAALTTPNDRPLQRIITARTCLGAGMPDGSLVLVRGEVLAFDSQRGAGVIDPRNTDYCEPGAYYSVPRVKLEISACGAAPVIIDADSEIVMPAGDASINVLAPFDWIRGRTTLAAPTLWTDMELRVHACPLLAEYAPEGVLTEWWRNVLNTTPNSVILRPRRARRVEMNNRDNAGVLATMVTNWLDGPAGGIFSGVLWPTGPATVNAPGASPALQIVGVAAGVNAYMRWEIR